VKIGYFADGPWSHRALEKLNEDDRFEIVFIVPRYDTQDPVLREWAGKIGVDYLLLKNVNSYESLELLKRYQADLFISMSFNQILKRDILNMSPKGFINCHAGELPYYRGRNILNWALINDAKQFGVTVHYVDEGVDTGDIIVQEVKPITDEDTYATLLDRAVVLCANLLMESVVQIHKGRVVRRRQNDIHPVGFYCCNRSEGDEWIDWNWSSRRIFNFVRSISSPRPSARTLYNGKVVAVHAVSLIENAPEYIGTPGEIVGLSNGGLIVKTGDSTILVDQLEVIPSAATELMECRFRIGQRFGRNNGVVMSELLERISNLEQQLALALKE